MFCRIVRASQWTRVCRRPGERERERARKREKERANESTSERQPEPEAASRHPEASRENPTKERARKRERGRERERERAGPASSPRELLTPSISSRSVLFCATRASASATKNFTSSLSASCAVRSAHTNELLPLVRTGCRRVVKHTFGARMETVWMREKEKENTTARRWAGPGSRAG
eukprot:566341-Rhodomonas_salina.2